MNKPAPSHPRLIILTRYPVPGQVKTRLLTALAPEQAAQLHRALTEYTVGMANTAHATCGIEIELRTCGAPTEQFSQWLGDEIRYCDQGNGDLGEKILRSLAEAFATGSAPVLVIGSDCPGMNPVHIEKALAALTRADVVIGPAADGGYYLIGLNRLLPELFIGIQWGGDEVLEQTCRRAEALSLKIELLETLSDIDRPEDLSILPPQIRGEIF